MSTFRHHALAASAAILLCLSAAPAFSAGSDSGSSNASSCAKGEAYDDKLKKCVKKTSELDDRQLLDNAKAFAYAGRYEEALTLLGQIRDKDRAEVLNYLGYATRKSGDLEGGLAWYRRALAIDPGYTLARSYMGEALIMAGQRDAAVEQLAEIKARCGMGCREYAILARALTGVAATDGQTW